MIMTLRPIPLLMNNPSLPSPSTALAGRDASIRQRDKPRRMLSTIHRDISPSAPVSRMLELRALGTSPMIAVSVLGTFGDF
jgi:hypothetical protein